MTFDIITFTAQIVNFLLLLWILKKFLYAPILNAMRDRKESIIKSLKDAEMKQVEAGLLKEKSRQALEDVRKERISMLEKVEKEVQQERRRMLDELEREKSTIRAEFEEQLRVEKKKFVNEVNKVVANKFVEFSQNVFSELSNAEIEAQVIEIFLQKIEKLKESEINKINTSAKASNGEVIISTSSDLSKETEEKIKNALKEVNIKYERIKFKKESEIILGISLQTGGYIVSWDLKEFLNNFKEELTKILM